ncbi:XRE family transcriptional regulator [Micromonospora fluostatini]|uniref:XRE family transcriptional regulator n=1 Tax=Micromonospora fluostatini TaxID=1629071 RepID=A0ABY2DMB1_9ACTN|nr:XRE family transcriptional regulator [Micromonospora fluostatini]
MPPRSQTRRPRKPLRHNPDALREAREAARLTQAQLAATVGISPGFYSELESGQRGASEDTLARIATALRLPVTLLEPPKPQRCPWCRYPYAPRADGRIPLHVVRPRGRWCPRGGTPVVVPQAAVA